MYLLLYSKVVPDTFNSCGYTNSLPCRMNLRMHIWCLKFICIWALWNCHTPVQYYTTFECFVIHIIVSTKCPPVMKIPVHCVIYLVGCMHVAVHSSSKKHVASYIILFAFFWESYPYWLIYKFFSPGVTCMAKNGDRKIPLLESVFKAFPDIPINVDIKSNSDELINKVSVHVRIMILIFCFTVVCRVYIIYIVNFQYNYICI